MIFIFIIIAIIMFGVLVALHEFGHFLTAKLLGVQVNEFAIGMGPTLWKRQKEETQYSLRLFPVGGFCAMEGEDEETDNPRAFTAQPVWKRLIILAAGSVMNFLTGFIIILLLFSQSQAFSTPVIDGFADGFALSGENGLQEGDRILKVDGENIYIYSDISIFFSRSNGETMDLVIQRDGKTIALDDFPLKLQQYTENGQTITRYGINFSVVPATVGMRLREAWFHSVDFVRLVRVSLGDLFSGHASLKDVSGPIGIVDALTQVGEQSQTAGVAAMNIFYFAALIAINLAVMNLLPIPALDGGRIFFLLISSVITLFTKKKVDPKYEGYIHFAGLICLLALMVVVAFNDIIKIIAR